MATSNIKRLRNEMRMLEDESDRYIPFDLYYIVKIQCETSNTQAAEKWGKNFLTRNPSHQPLVSYIFKTESSVEIVLVYSCLEESEEHWNDGSHSEIVSHYSSLLSRELRSKVNVKIVEFETRTHVLTYLSWLIHENSRVSMVLSSANEVTASDIRSHTHQELLEKLDSVGVDWEAFEPSEKYGTFYKLKKRKGKVVIASMSEAFDARDTRKYSAFVFGS